jgi:PIN domain nuclease of toxin-antitoxin system
MNYLLDTHILLWARLDQKRLTPEQKTVIVSRDEQKFISAVTVWEISLKYALGKLELGGLTPDEFIAGSYKLGIGAITPTTEQYSQSYTAIKILLIE